MASPVDGPTGDFCFLFSDIEGSTNLARNLGPDAWAALLRAHDRHVDDAVGRSGGLVVSHEGDGVFAVFPGGDATASALAAAVTIQRGVADLPAIGARPQLRIGLHTGRAQRDENGFIGIDVHFAARVAGAGNGGQVIVSAETVEAADGSIPEGTTLIDEGFRLLKDFDEPRRLYRLSVPDAADDPRPLRTLDLPSNLPAVLSTVVGREDDIASCVTLLEQSRLVTLTGPGGTGKTRLALGVADAARRRFAAGTWLVDLSPVRDPALIASAIGAALDVSESTDQTVLERLKDHLRDRSLLLLLDNLEQLLPAASMLVAELIGASAGLRVLATSRVPLHLGGEQEYPVPPLSRDAGVQLFLDRARQVRPTFDPAGSEASIQGVVERLGGLPLAIELAAARIRIFGPEAILERLGRSLEVLASSALDLPPRQRTLRATIGWSVDLLGEPERRMFRRLGVFEGAWSIDTARDVLDPDANDVDVTEGLEALVDRSLLRLEGSIDGEPRFGWHPLVREYAVEELTAAGERPQVERRHALVFLALAEQAEPELLGADGTAWLARIDAARHDLRAAMQWSIDAGEPRIGLRIIYGVWRFFHQRAELREGRAWAERLLAHPGADAGSAPRERILGLAAAGGLAYWAQDAVSARAAYEERLELAERLGDDRLLADAHYDLGFSDMVDKDIDGLQRHMEAAKVSYDRLGDVDGTVRVRQGLVLVSMAHGDMAGARALERANLQAFRAASQSYRISDSLTLLATIELEAGDHAEARLLAREGLAIVGGDRLAGTTVGALGVLSLIELRTGDAELGARLAGAAAAIAEGAHVTNALVDVLHVSDPAEVASEVLGDRARALLLEGAALPIDDAVALAIGRPGE